MVASASARYRSLARCVETNADRRVQNSGCPSGGLLGVIEELLDPSNECLVARNGLSAVNDTSEAETDPGPAIVNHLHISARQLMFERGPGVLTSSWKVLNQDASSQLADFFEEALNQVRLIVHCRHEFLSPCCRGYFLCHIVCLILCENELCDFTFFQVLSLSFFVGGPCISGAT